MKSKVFESKLEVRSLHFICAMWCIGAILAISTPTDILDYSPAIKLYVDPVLTLISPDGKLGSRSNFPQVTQLYYALMVWTVPCFAIISHSWMLTRVAKDRDGLMFKQKLSITNKVWLVVLLPVWAIFIYFASLNHGGDTRLIPFGGSRWALGIFGVAFPLGAGVMLALIGFSIRRVFFERNLDHG